MDDVTGLAKEWWLLAVLGAVAVVSGVLAIAYPGPTLLATGIIFGCYLVLAAVYAILQAVMGDSESRALSAIVGVLALLAGLMCLRRPGESVLALVLVLGAYLIVTGGVELVSAFGSAEHRGLSLLAAATDIVLGILILALPEVSVVTLTLLFGIALIVRGTVAFLGALRLRRMRHDGADMPGPAGAAAV